MVVQAGTSSFVLMSGYDWNTLNTNISGPANAEITFNTDVERGETHWLLRANPLYPGDSVLASVTGNPADGYTLTTSRVSLHNNWDQQVDYVGCDVRAAGCLRFVTFGPSRAKVCVTRNDESRQPER